MIGHFATGVTVVTAEREGRLHGMTANSVTSVSLEPLLLSVCIERSAAAHDHTAAAGRFAVNILGADQEAVARLFAVPGPPEPTGLRGVRFRTGPHGNPWIEGCLAYLDCEVERLLDGGDHSIFLGRVLHGEVARDGDPLLYYRGAYHGPALE